MTQPLEVRVLDILARGWTRDIGFRDVQDRIDLITFWNDGCGYCRRSTAGLCGRHDLPSIIQEIWRREGLLHQPLVLPSLFALDDTTAA